MRDTPAACRKALISRALPPHAENVVAPSISETISLTRSFIASSRTFPRMSSAGQVPTDGLPERGAP